MKHRIHLLLLELMEDHDLHTRERFLRDGRSQLLDLVDALGDVNWHDIVGFGISRSKDTGWSGALNFASGTRIGTPDQRPRPSFEQAERDIALVAAALRFGMADKPSEQDGEGDVEFLLDGELFTLERFDIRAETDRARAWARTVFPEAAGNDARLDEIVASWCWIALEEVTKRIQDTDLSEHEERALYERLVTAVSILAGRGIGAYECCAGRHGGPGSSGSLNRIQLETRSASLPKPPGGRRSEPKSMGLTLDAVLTSQRLPPGPADGAMDPEWLTRQMIGCGSQVLRSAPPNQKNH